jgi:hypothetical protein
MLCRAELGSLDAVTVAVVAVALAEPHARYETSSSGASTIQCARRSRLRDRDHRLPETLIDDADAPDGVLAEQ